MPRKHFGSIATIAMLLIVLFWSNASDVSSAKGKPPKNPTATPTPGSGGCPDHGGGLIYYADAADVVHERDADCGTDRALPALPAYVFRPSKELHDARRWFLRTETVPGVPPDPNGRTTRELWTYAEDGASVRLTDYTLGGTTSGPTFLYDGGLQWAPDDAFVSWVAGHWVDDDGDGSLDRIDQAGIYRATVLYDANGVPTGLSDPRPALPTVVVETVVTGLPVYRHAWAPDASRLAYGLDYQLFRVDAIPSGDPASHINIATGDAPDWSSSDRIAFNTSARNRYKVRSIRPDGSDEIDLASDRRNFVGFPWWSPTGSHAIYASDPCCPFDTYRVDADGNGKALVVADGDALGWVAQD